MRRPKPIINVRMEKGSSICKNLLLSHSLEIEYKWRDCKKHHSKLSQRATKNSRTATPPFTSTP
jgi:hypothetical protein